MREAFVHCVMHPFFFFAEEDCEKIEQGWGGLGSSVRVLQASVAA